MLMLGNRIDRDELAILPNYPIVIKDKAIWTLGQQYSDTATGEIDVQSPSIIPVPFAILNGPKYIGRCPDPEFQLISLSGSAGRSWKSVGLTYTSDTPPLNNLTTFLNDIALKIKNEDVQSFTIPQNILTAGNTFSSII